VTIPLAGRGRSPREVTVVGWTMIEWTVAVALPPFIS
jgi:hypothetical protein